MAQRGRLVARKAANWSLNNSIVLDGLIPRSEERGPIEAISRPQSWSSRPYDSAPTGARPH